MNSQELFYIPGRKVAPINMTKEKITADAVADLQKIGIVVASLCSRNALDQRHQQVTEALAADSLQPTVTTPTVSTPIQFLQNWLPGLVRVITQARKIDELIGIKTAGAWEDEQIVQGIMEVTGKAVPYGDKTNIPLSSWNVNWETRTNIRFEEGMEVGLLEQKRAARMQVDAAGGKRDGAAEALEIQRNNVGFYGYNDGDNRTYGFLNDPGLLAYEPIPANEAGDTMWEDKDYLDIVNDILTMAAQLRVQSKDTIDPYSVKTTLAVGTNPVNFLAKVSQFGNSVQDWIDKTFKGNMRVVSAPELDGAHTGANVTYLYADAVAGDGSTDDSRTWVQVVPAKFYALGVEPGAKGFKEDYSNATAGAFCKRPYAVTRWYGN